MVFLGILCGMLLGGATALLGIFTFDFSIWLALASYSVVGSTTAAISTLALYVWSSSDDDWTDYNDYSRKDDALAPFECHSLEDRQVGTAAAA